MSFPKLRSSKAPQDEALKQDCWACCPFSTTQHSGSLYSLMFPWVSCGTHFIGLPMERIQSDNLLTHGLHSMKVSYY